MATTLPTNTAHPLLADLANAEENRIKHLAAEREHFQQYFDTVEAIATHAAHKATSQQPAYCIHPNRAWEYLGPYEWDSVRVIVDPDPLAIAINLPTRGPGWERSRETRNQIWAAIRSIHPLEQPTPLPAKRYVNLIAAAEKAADLVSTTLAIGIANNIITWDTGETLAEAGLRIARDAAYRMRATRRVAATAEVFGEVLDMLDWTARPPADYARAYVDQQTAIDQAVDAASIEWGMPTVTGDEAARIASISASGWRSHVAREEAPPKDAGKGWRRSTVLAWSLGRTRASRADGWD